MKKLTPIIISVITIVYFAMYFIMIFFIDKTSGFDTVFMVIFGLTGLGFIIAMIYTLMVRLKEIDKEDKDDLSKY